jgi:hypothetical protein
VPEQPHDPPLNDPALDALAGALRGLAPRPGGFDRDRLMFRAGRASAPRGWAWPLATAASGAAAVALAVLLWARPEPPPRVVYVQADRPQPAASDGGAPGPHAEGASGGWSHYLQLQDKLLRDGLDGLPAPPDQPPERDGPPTVDALLQSL